MAFHQKKKKAPVFSFSILDNQPSLISLVRGDPEWQELYSNLEIISRSALIREALECLRENYKEHGKDWRLRLHEQKKPIWVSEIINEIHNIEKVAVRDSDLEVEEGIDIEIGEMFDEG